MWQKFEIGDLLIVDGKKVEITGVVKKVNNFYEYQLTPIHGGVVGWVDDKYLLESGVRFKEPRYRVGGIVGTAPHYDLSRLGGSLGTSYEIISVWECWEYGNNKSQYVPVFIYEIEIGGGEKVLMWENDIVN